MVHVDGEVRIMMIFVIKCDASSDQIKLWKMLGWLNFVFAGMNFDLELEWTEAADVVCYFLCVMCL